MKVLLIAILSFLSVALSAQTISEEDALQEAQKFIHAQNTRATGHRKFANGSTLSLIKTGMAPESKSSLGLCYRSGIGFEQDYNMSFKLFREAALKDEPMAQYLMGQAYENGEGVEIDRDEAINWYKLSASNGYSLAQTALENI